MIEMFFRVRRGECGVCGCVCVGGGAYVGVRVVCSLYVCIIHLRGVSLVSEI